MMGLYSPCASRAQEAGDEGAGVTTPSLGSSGEREAPEGAEGGDAPEGFSRLPRYVFFRMDGGKTANFSETNQNARNAPPPRSHFGHPSRDCVPRESVCGQLELPLIQLRLHVLRTSQI